jgi:hypothetical protein
MRMQPKWTRRCGIAAIIGLTAWASVGCAEERAAISRVQPNVLDKSFFVGADLASTSDDPEFYMRNTVVDVPYGAGQDGLFTATYAQPVNRIKWEITENNLIARMTHERIADSDFKGSKRTNDGQVVAMFKIEKHFDIRRNYNPTTGEEINVVEENDSDRPWQMRQQFRVDWSTNLVTDGYQVDTASMLGAFDGVKWNPLSYYVQDKNDPDAPQFDTKNGYFDITAKVFATPNKVDIKGFGMVPACYLTSEYPASNCNSTEVTLRLSFKKVVDTDFEATEWDGDKQEAFGVFTEDRFGFDRSYGLNDQKWHRFQAKFNTWEKSHIESSQCAVDYWRDANGAIGKFKFDGAAFAIDSATGLPIPDPNGKPFSGFTGSSIGRDIHADANKNGTEDVCEFKDGAGAPIHEGSRCDEFARKCTLPAYERKTKATAWYYGADSPPDLFSSTADALNQWNVAVRLALQIRMKVEAERVGFDGNQYVIDEEVIRADVKGEKVPNVFVFCHNPVVEGDAKECGAPGLKVRVGDLRYSMVNLIQKPQTNSPWGIMVDAVDPLTGEKIAGSANEWTHVLDSAAASTSDLLKWFNGELADEQIYSGTYLKDWVESSKLGTAEYRPKTLDAAEIEARIKSIDLKSLAPMSKPVSKDFATTIKDPELRRRAAESLSRKTGPGLDAQFESIRQGLLGSPLEAAMMTPNRLQAAGFDPRKPFGGDETVLEKASPLRSKSIQFRRYVDHMKATSLAQHGACMVEQPEPNAMAGLARLANKLYPKVADNDPDVNVKRFQRNKDILQWLRSQLHLGVIAHELGHSMGLRHNFTGTWDAMNFHKEYWQLRTRNNAEKGCRALDGDRGFGKKLHTDGKECVGPRWVDPVTEEETNGLVWKWGTSTVMDYPGDTSQDFNGLGPYDKAAVRFFYGETFDVDAEMNAAKKNDYPDYLGNTSPFYFSQKHYSEFNDAYNLIRNCAAPTDPNDPLTGKCEGPKLDYVRYSDMKNVGNSNWAFDKKDRVRHPYMFSSDEFASPTNVESTRFDSGADPYEKMQFLVTAYENRYIFDNFRRGRVQFNSQNVVNRAGGRYFDMIAGITKSLGLYSQIFGEIYGRDLVDQLVGDAAYLMPLALASSDGFSMFARIMTRPEPGEYATFDVPGTTAKYARTRLGLETAATSDGFLPVAFNVAVGSGEGRYINNDYDFSQGYYWSDYQTRVGSTYEKTMALEYMLEAYNRFVQVDRRDFIDGRWKNINYATLYPEQMRRLFSSITQSDPMTMGAYIVAPAGGATPNPVARVQYPSWDKAAPLTYPAGAITLDPLFGWEQQYPALLYGFYFAPTTLTMDWYDQMRVFVKGGNEDIQVNGPVVSFEDPESRIVYNARDYGTEQIHGMNVSRNSGARMIGYANALRAQAFVIDGDAVRYDATTHTPVVNDQVKATQLRGFVANLAVVRQMAEWFGSGPLGRGN